MGKLRRKINVYQGITTFPLVKSADVILMVQSLQNVMRMAIAFAKHASQAKNVMNANQLSLVKNVTHVNQITSSCTPNAESVIVTRMVQSLCNVTSMVTVLAKLDFMARNVMIVIVTLMVQLLCIVTSLVIALVKLGFMAKNVMNVIVILMVQPLCNVMTMVIALVKMVFMEKIVILFAKENPT